MVPYISKVTYDVSVTQHLHMNKTLFRSYDSFD